MSIVKYFFKDVEDERCYRKEYWLSEMKADGAEELKLYEAVVSDEKDFFYCKAIQEVGEKGECGKQCKDYAPRNGKSGCCKHLGKLYEPSEIVTLNINSKIKRNETN
jgi:hypothetical protein